MTSNFEELHTTMRAQVDQSFLPCVSTALLRGSQVVDKFHYGFSDIEASSPLREDHIFRMFSSTKLVTACAALMLFEKKHFQLEDPIEAYIPELGNRQVLKTGALSIEDVEPAGSSITIRQLMNHTSGLSYGMFDPGTVLFNAYKKASVMHPGKPLSEMISALAPLPLAFHPGTKWEYSVATDVIARLIEVISGDLFGRFLSKSVFQPLGMIDTDFWVPEHKMNRLCELYVEVDPLDSTKPRLTRAKDKPFAGAYTRKMPRESGGGGLVSTLGDTVKLIQSFFPGGPRILKQKTIDLMFQNHLTSNLCVQFPGQSRVDSKGFGLGSSVTISGNAAEPSNVIGEVGWGGLAGTAWWINPRIGIAGVFMTQRYLGSENPFSLVFKQQAYRSLGYA